MQTFLTDKQRTEIAKQDAEFWERYGCCLLALLPLLVLSLVLIAGGYWLTQSSTFPTDDRIDAEITSPDGVYVAAVVTRSSGSIAPSEGGAERVLLRRVSEKFIPDSEGHINVEPVYDDVDSYSLEVKWQGNRTLLIRTNGCWRGATSKVELKTNWHNVTIKYHSCERTQR